MGIRFILMVNKQGQTRLAQYYEYLTLEERRALEGEIVRKCLARNEQQCSFVEHRNYKIVYRRYASLFFLVGVDNEENELAILEFIHLLVETMDRHFGNVVIGKSFGFDTAVEEAQRAINAAHVEAESNENGIGLVKLMGRCSGYIAMYATLASRDVDCRLIPESPFYLEGAGRLFEYIEKKIKENGHMVIVVAEGAGQDLLSEVLRSSNQQDASGNKLLQDVGLWISQSIKRKRCIKWLKGHTDTITGAMYNCKDEHLASVSLSGDVILHSLASGAKAAEFKDPKNQVLRVLDYSRISCHLLATAGDDGSIHLWDTIGRGPKISWLKQHSTPTAGICFSPSNDKVIATVGLDKKLYTFDSGSRRHSFCIPYEAPFSSLAYRDVGLILAAGTSNGEEVFYDVRGKPQPLTVLRAFGNSEAVTSLCWQRSKPVVVNENNCAAETALLGGALEDSILMPDPLPSMTPSSASTLNSLNSSTLETPLKSTLWSGRALARLNAARSCNFKDGMEVFSPLMEVQPITPSVSKLWEGREGLKKDHLLVDNKPSALFSPSSKRYSPSEGGGSNFHPIFDWKASSTAKQDDTCSIPQLVSTPAASSKSDDSSITPPETT